MNRVVTVARFEGTALRGLLPVQYALVKNLPQRVFDAHLPLRGLLEKDAKHLYVKTCQGFKSYGHKFYDVKYVEGSKKRTIDRLLGLGPQGLLILDDKTAVRLPFSCCLFSFFNNMTKPQKQKQKTNKSGHCARLATAPDRLVGIFSELHLFADRSPRHCKRPDGVPLRNQQGRRNISWVDAPREKPERGQVCG